MRQMKASVLVSIHGTAIVDSCAEIGDDVEIGAFSYIGPQAIIGAGSIIHHHATVEGFTRLGSGCEVYPYAFIGGKTQDLKFTGGVPGLKIGARNVFREYCTVHLATNDGDFTLIGSNNYFMAYSHISHDCLLGDGIKIGHACTLGGHMEVHDCANIGGGHTAIHPFCRIGRFAYTGGCSKVVQDIPPYMLGDGNPAEIRTINRIGMQRNHFSEEEISLARRVFKILYREGLNRRQALERLREDEESSQPIVRTVREFIEAGSERGLA